MIYFPPTLILRHRRENLKKCSLRGLESRSDMIFLTYPLSNLPNIDQYCILTLNAPELSPDDASRRLLLIDGTWRYAQTMIKIIPTAGSHVFRSLPTHFQTAYPRRQPDCPDPTRGLASVEALYVAYSILGRSPTAFSDHYHWKEEFLGNRLQHLTA